MNTYNQRDWKGGYRVSVLGTGKKEESKRENISAAVRARRHAALGNPIGMSR